MWFIVYKTDNAWENKCSKSQSAEQINQLRQDTVLGDAPAGAQQEVEDQARDWHLQWGKGLELTPVRWPDDMGTPPPELVVDALLEAARTFPDETGLGWDRTHPKAIGRLSKELLILFVHILMRCEAEGEWPESIALILIALLPKPDGGYRPTGLVPLLPRLWMRARKGIASQWEARPHRSYLYAGKRKGANVAA